MYLAELLFLLSLAVWVGSIVFFTFVVSPAVVNSISNEQAAKVINAIYAPYYRLGYLCGAAASLALLVRRLSGGRMWPTAWFMLLVLMVLMAIFLDVVIGDRARMAEETLQADPKQKENFYRLHRISLGMNLLMLGAGFLLMWLTASRLDF